MCLSIFLIVSGASIFILFWLLESVIAGPIDNYNVILTLRYIGIIILGIGIFSFIRVRRNEKIKEEERIREINERERTEALAKRNAEEKMQKEEGEVRDILEKYEDMDQSNH